MGTTTQSRQCSTPSTFVVSTEMNATDDVFGWAAREPDHPSFARKVDGVWRPVTARKFAEQVTALAAGLIGVGIRPGDRVALLSATRYEWALCDYAILTVGAVTVPIYETSSVEQIRWILRDSGATAIVVDSDSHLAAVRQAGVESVRRHWVIDSGGLGRLAAAGATVPVDAVARRRRDVTAGQVASIVYTSGTTGRPKGCVISHANLLAEVHSVAAAEGISDAVLTDRASILLFLPLAHILARVVQFAAARNGTQIAHTSDIARVPDELREFRPTIVLAVPRVFERLYNTAARKAAAEGHAGLFRAAETVAIGYSRALDGPGPGRWLRVRRYVYDRLVYGKLRAALGGRVTHAVSGGAPLSTRIGHFLRGAGMTILDGYGLTETTAGVALNLPASWRIGTVGRPLPGCTIRIAADGEVLVKAPVVFDGYWRNENATDEAFDGQGWLRTGDLGQLDGGFLTITGRKKDLIITASGKNVAPAPFEDRLRANWLIDECLVVGDRRPYIGALLTLDPQAFEQWKREHGRSPRATVAQLRDDPALLGTLQAVVDEVNRTVSTAEAIKRIRIVPGQFAVGDDLTPTQKVRREHVLRKLAGDVDALYQPDQMSEARR